jgi:hypothetical protein
LLDKQGVPVPIVSLADWELKRAAAMNTMQEVMGPLPGAEKRCPLNLQVIDERD